MYQETESPASKPETAREKTAPTPEEKERKEILARYRALLRAVQPAIKSTEDRKRIKKAFETALAAHKDVRRKSGEPYIFHPIAVAEICAKELNLGVTSVVCALLHDTVEDSDLTLDEIESMFGREVRQIIDGLTKIEGFVDTSESIQAENFRKILLTLSNDIRVILIKLADRLHNMRTLEYMKREKQLKIANETLFLYAPLAHRLGLYRMKTEMEDLALKYTEPDIYHDIVSRLKKSEEVRNRFINSFIQPIKKKLTEQGFKFEIKGRTKSIYSIYNKIKNKGVPFEEIYDIFAIRIIIDSEPQNEKADCWRVYSIVTDFYQPKPDRLRDWISFPKSNGYESLHITVMSPTGKWVEVQIRTRRMDEIAERGYAAHWKYKESSIETNIDEWLRKVRAVLEQGDQNAVDFVESFKLDLVTEEIFVFTPKGELKALPTGSTALDFAYEIHSDIGDHCLGAKVNGRLVPLSYVLQSGDQVEIITSSKQKPKEDWLKIVKTSKARHKIKQALREEKRRLAEEGREQFERKLRHLGFTFSEKDVPKIIRFFQVPNIQDFYVRVATDVITNNDIRRFYKEELSRSWYDYFRKKLRRSPSEGKKETTPSAPTLQELLKKTHRSEDSLIIGDNVTNLDYKLASCCNPIPGDEVFGFVTVNEGIKIHKTNCPNANTLLSNFAYRVVKARWTSSEDIAFQAGITIRGFDDVGIVNRITRIISNQLKVNMKSINFESNEGLFEGRIMLFVHDTQHLEDLMEKLRHVPGVIAVERMG
ncbi:MAG: bifunctional (p)ppGpp synthetase/guanosine-3',5'-bis(diphosphate) 3'-pyrophosphohydrolase [Flavobacteriales bacterium]|nr:bifunctional (p)ppGpp synthetase/guanosine-3',5'-bis(diphosphate) 3'-pyrophosphohydrolase [Flavobacteriales bacterium]MCX7768120.1 bifunctional (p)ppGpp synthetase/guanosine-3',5'-bis(diphosphate) 3'-pyrophosphohydrolase [Flavobacteriales bacterium]MDW8409588.1 bifunctional (p)ppGpp synthetase/guanosine-3',5'-bis(diphosphate) 3'-pyrophosphohydrolase [Flavobacteriales bacterium]